MTEHTTHTVETETGTYYIRIVAAERKTFSVYDGEASKPGEDLIPRIWISTDPDFEGDVDNGYVKIRGRKYAIEQFIQRLPANTTYPTRWSSEPSYRGGFRNDQGRKVKYEAKAYDTLGDMRDAALKQFAAQNPTWERESIARLFRRETEHHQYKANNLRKEAAAEDRQAAEWQARLDEVSQPA
ncbi:hypothetical protein [Streptomyces sp. NPDC055793]